MCVEKQHWEEWLDTHVLLFPLDVELQHEWVSPEMLEL